MSHRTYIGDGVYAWFDGFHIWLETERLTGFDRIALEPAVFKSLVDFEKKIREVTGGA